MDAKYFAEIKAREQAATLGPWISTWGLKDSTVYTWKDKTERVIAKLPCRKGMLSSDDARFIAHARTDIPALVAEVERLTDIEKEYLHYRRLSEKLDQQIAALSAEVERLKKCRDGCKIDCLLDKYNEAQEQIATLGEMVNKYQKATLKKALELMAMDLYDCHTANNVAIENAVANYIQQAQEQEGKK